MFPSELIARLRRAGVVAVVSVDESVDAVCVARALLAGGVSAIELAFRTPAALEALRRLRDEVPEMLAGAGTVLNATQLAQAADAGAMFAVAPGCNPATLRAARELGLPFAPGVVTPTDIEIAVENGCRMLKYFPAEPSGGLAYLRTMAAPFEHLGLEYIPLGGIQATQLADYLASPLVTCVGGSWLARTELIRRRDWAGIQRLAAEAMMLVHSVRKG